jgi:hypothetical protein
MLQVKNLNYDSWQTIYFQRSTVIISELFLLYALYVLVHLVLIHIEYHVLNSHLDL